MAQVRSDPFDAARRSDRTRPVGWKPPYEVDRTCDRCKSLLEGTTAFGAAATVELGGQRRSDAFLDRSGELASVEANIVTERILYAGLMTQLGQQVSDLTIALELAFEKDAVKVEDDGLWTQVSVLEQGGAHADGSCAEHDGFPVVGRHPHAEASDVMTARELREEREEW